MNNTRENLKAKVFHDNDPTLGYEINSFLRKTVNLFLIPILNLLPVHARKTIKKSNKFVAEIIDNATTHKALEILYKKGGSHSSFMGKISHFVWFNTNNSKAVRNRIKLVKRELKKRLRESIDSKKEISILSIAAGSARAIIESIIEAKIPQDIPLRITFLDKSVQALEYSQQLMDDMGLKKRENDRFTWVGETVNTYLKREEENYSIIEMVGLMDYFTDDKALTIFKNIHSLLKPGGIFITANINHNSEKKFVTKAIGWPMIYREAQHLGHLVHDAGFSEENIDLFYEPLKIHSVIIARKK